MNTTKDMSNPEPDLLCPHCKRGQRYTQQPPNTSVVRLNEYQEVLHYHCYNCGEVYNAVMRDTSEMFLNLMQSKPEDALEVVEDYSELKHDCLTQD